MGFLLCALGACVTLPHASPVDAARARERWPEVTQETLETARTTYVRRCSGCHLLYVPAARPAQEWPAALATMSKKARLKPDEAREVERFLIVMADHIAETR